MRNVALVVLFMTLADLKLRADFEENTEKRLKSRVAEKYAEIWIEPRDSRSIYTSRENS